MDQLTRRFANINHPSFAVLALMGADIVAICSALILALVLRFDSLSHPMVHRLLDMHAFSFPFIIALYLAFYAAFRLYRYAWRFASIEMLWGIVHANTLALTVSITMQYLMVGSVFPRSVLVIFWLLSIALVGGMRILLRLVNISRSHGERTLRVLRRDTHPQRVVILGGGTDGARLVAALREDAGPNYQVIGFLDDVPNKQGIYIRGVQVLGPLDHLYKLLEDRAVDEVLVAIPHASGAQIRDYVLACRREQVPVKVIPALQDVLVGKAHARLEEISVEDLLRRPPVCINIAEIGRYVSGKRVLVTGAGGSIGSELCRQIIALDPTRLVLFGHGENSLHAVQQELQHTHPTLAGRLHVAIGSISDDVRIDQVFADHQPQVVFHAAAHKHVPLMEANIPEAVQNNVMGTRCVAQACGRGGVERMVLISTDKAVYPSSVMGATKWLCEEVMRAMAATHPNTAYLTVRFGNVLGSRGSVVPIFKEQIKRGGPITITHPEITRYFMTIPEAVQLVLQAGAVGTSGELFLLDMGEPVRIVDLARDMIRLCGLEPEVDIQLAYSGLRPGERIYELLVSGEEELRPAACPGFSLVQRPQYFTPPQYAGVLRRLQQLASSNDTPALLAYLNEIVPSFAQQHQVLSAAATSEANVAASH